MRRKTLTKLPLALAFAIAMGSLSACTGYSSSSVYGGYGYPYYGSNWGYSSSYYGHTNDWDRHEHLDQGERIERRDQIRQGAGSRPAGGGASRNMGRPSGGAMRGGGGGRMGGRR